MHTTGRNQTSSPVSYREQIIPRGPHDLHARDYAGDEPAIVRVARRLHELLPTPELFLLPHARHYVQMDEPQRVAQLILTLPRPKTLTEA